MGKQLCIFTQCLHQNCNFCVLNFQNSVIINCDTLEPSAFSLFNGAILKYNTHCVLFFGQWRTPVMLRQTFSITQTDQMWFYLRLQAIPVVFLEAEWEPVVSTFHQPDLVHFYIQPVSILKPQKRQVFSVVVAVEQRGERIRAHHLSTLPLPLSTLIMFISPFWLNNRNSTFLRITWSLIS